jgi:ribosomal protein S18 acetylase RimI-like enzyme
VFRSATRADLSAIRTTFIRSFWDDPVMRWLVPGDADFENVTMMDDFFARLIAYGHSLVTPDVASFSLWIPPGRPEVDYESVPTDAPSDELVAKFIALGEAIASNTPTDEHWYLQMIGTHPDWQGRGIGSMLIREGQSWARRDGLGVYLETETIENVAYYRHLGFEVRTEWEVATGGPHMWGMWIPPA